MEQVVVKTEIQNNGEILLYYVDENGENQQGVVTTLENVENSGIQLQDNYILSNLEDFVNDSSLHQAEIEEPEPQFTDWSDEDTKRLLIFYTDNKPAFLTSAVLKKKHLWTVACKTMLIGKDYESCEMQLREIKSKYAEVCGFTEKGIYVKWPFLDLCHKAFHDDIEFNTSSYDNPIKAKVAVLKQETPETETTRVVKQINTRSADEHVEQMLYLYLKYKHKFQAEHWRKDLWDTIALEMGQAEDGEYWHKRFLNYKQHYIGMLIKQKENGSNPVNWPYMELFNQIYDDDVNFHKKYFNASSAPVNENGTHRDISKEWTTTHITVLGKYYFDSYDEFEDPTIPDMFLWTEVGRLIDMKPESCMDMFAQLREEHIEKYLAGGYNLQNRTAIAIILDNIIARDVKKEMMESKNMDGLETWKTAQTDELVQFFFENIEIFKDTVCYFVCWEVVARKLKQDIESCKRHWDELVSLYNSILEDKKDDPDLQIDWRYIEMFDRIFDYGMDVAFIKGYSDNMQYPESGRVGVKKVTINTENDEEPTINSKPVVEQSQTPRTDPRSTKILEFYLKNKDRFHHLKNRLGLWEPLAKEIKINSTQCAHRFRHLKQTYIDTVQKEIDQPKVTITWPYFALCKKVFGYRTIKNKLKHGTLTADSDDWLARELKQLISYFSKNFHEITNNIDDISIWSTVANELGKPPLSCKDKFLELRKCYRKLKTMKTRNPDVKISWSHFAMFDRIYTEREEPAEGMDVEHMEEEHLEMDGLELAEGGEDDYQCIIVLQEGQDLTDINNAQIIIQNPTEMEQEIEAIPEKVLEEPPKLNTWTKRTKKLLLTHYINYMRSHRGKKINQKQLWEDIAAKIPNKTQIQCKKMFIRLKNAYKNSDEEKQKSYPFHTLMEKVLKLKTKSSISPIKDAQLQKTYKDVDMDPQKIESALNYYLEHIDDFVDPKFEKKYLWTELANHISEPVYKVYNKINYLKQAYNVETEEIDGQKTQWNGILNEIIVKEVSMNVLIDEAKPYFDDDESNWSVDLTESLLTWYLGNLDKFKNPKFNRSYLWMEASGILSKSPVVCSKKMSEIRTQYRNMVKNNSGELEEWRFYELCQKIYGTGKKSNEI